jgi:CheY-like chemotaxis protein
MKVLVIDDEESSLKQVHKLLSDTPGPDGHPFDVTAVASHQDALQRLDERYDVIITDMVMGQKETEGLDILGKLVGQSPVTIVLTARAAFPNCVEAMRMGAWDYLEKVPLDGSDPYENLLRSINRGYQARLATPNEVVMFHDSLWVRDHMGELMKKYPGELVAVLDGRDVDHDKEYDKLLTRVKGRFPVSHPTIVSIPDTTAESIG